MKLGAKWGFCHKEVTCSAKGFKRITLAAVLRRDSTGKRTEAGGPSVKIQMRENDGLDSKRNGKTLETF